MPGAPRRDGRQAARAVRVTVTGRGDGDPERVGGPTALGQASRFEWIPLESVPRMIDEGETRSASSLVALTRVLLKWRYASSS
jgi:hypothetical protein